MDQPTADRIKKLDEQIASARALAWNASQMRRSPFAALAILDRAVDEKRRLLRANH